MVKGFSLRVVAILVAVVFAVSSLGFARTSGNTSYKKSSSSKVTESSKASSKMAKLKSSRPKARTYSAKTAKKKKSRKRSRHWEHFYTNSYVDDPTIGDLTEGEDPTVRAAAVEALGNFNGTIVAVDPDTGRILTMVNQKLALSEGAQPCSTFKTAVGLAALSEGIIERDTKISLSRRFKIDLTYALAHSNNTFFENIGRKLGFEKVSHWAQQFGLGEMAGYDIEGEHLGTFPEEEISSKLGGVGKMCSFGEGISMTPLQLAAMTAAIANGGNLYYLQHPRTQAALANFTPRLKRTLEIAKYIPDVSEGMMGAVEYGTARRLRANFMEEPILGKTGTCSKDGTRFGWFTSFANTDHGRIVTVVFLRGGYSVFGPKAAEVTGKFYRKLYDGSFFAADKKAAPESHAVVSNED